MVWGTPEEIERRRRIFVSVWAYAYEYMNVSLVDDATFDAECLKIDLTIRTGNKKMDNWFRKNFNAFTGMWVRNHPEKAGLERIYNLIVKDK